MNIGKLGIFLIILVFGLMALGIAALLIPEVGSALAEFGGNTVPSTIAGFFIGVLSFGTEGGPQAGLVYGSIMIVTIILWTYALSPLWNKARNKQPPTITPQINTPYSGMGAPTTQYVTEQPKPTGTTPPPSSDEEKK